MQTQAPPSHGRRKLETIPLFPQHEGPSLRPQVTQVKMTSTISLNILPIKLLGITISIPSQTPGCREKASKHDTDNKI